MSKWWLYSICEWQFTVEICKIYLKHFTSDSEGEKFLLHLTLAIDCTCQVAMTCANSLCRSEYLRSSTITLSFQCNVMRVTYCVSLVIFFSHCLRVWVRVLFVLIALFLRSSQFDSSRLKREGNEREIGWRGETWCDVTKRCPPKMPECSSVWMCKVHAALSVTEGERAQM